MVVCGRSDEDLTAKIKTKRLAHVVGIVAHFFPKMLMDIMWPISQSHFHVSCLCSLK